MPSALSKLTQLGRGCAELQIPICLLPDTSHPLNSAVRGNRAHDCSSSMIFSFSFLHLFIVVKYTECEITILTSFQVYNSVTLNTFSVLCNHHHCLFADLFPAEALCTCPVPRSRPWPVCCPAFGLGKVAGSRHFTEGESHSVGPL